MTDYDRQLIKRISKLTLGEHQSKLVRSIKRWYKHSGGLSDKQVAVLKSIENDNA